MMEIRDTKGLQKVQGVETFEFNPPLKVEEWTWLVSTIGIRRGGRGLLKALDKVRGAQGAV